MFEGLRGRRSKPALNVAMTAGNAEAITAWCRLVLAPGVIDRLGKRLFELLEAKDTEGCTALGRALANGHAKALEEFHDLLVNPAIAARLGNTLCGLLAAPLKAGVPGLLHAMQDGHADAVRVFHAMLVAPTVLPRIVFGLSGLVRARAPRTGIPGLTAGARTTGLVQAMKYGHADSIRAFHAMVVNPRIFPRIRESLPSLVTDKGRDGTGCLAVALEYGHAGAIRAFCAMVADPSITPSIEDVLHEVVLIQTPHGQTGLGLALEKGYANAIKEFHAFMVDPAIRPFIARSISKVVVARQRGGTLGLSLALRNNHAPAIDAYADMLADPALLPLVRHDLSRLIQRVLDEPADILDAPLTSKSLPATRKNQRAAWTSFRLMVKRPEIAAHLDEKTLEGLRGLEMKDKGLEMDETAAMAQTTRTTRTDTISQRGAALAVVPARPSMRSVIARIGRRFAGHPH